MPMSDIIDTWRLSRVDAMRFNVDDPDVRVVEIYDYSDWRSVARDIMGGDIIELTVRNDHPDEDVRHMCPAIHLALLESRGRAPVNHHLLRFLRAIGAHDYSKTVDAMAFGSKGDSLLSIPSVLHMSWASDLVSDVPKEYGIDGGKMRLLCACSECHSKSVRCSLYLPCDRCKARDVVCRVSEAEHKKRAVNLFHAINYGTIPHDDHAVWQLYLQHCHYVRDGIKPPTCMVKKTEQRCLSERMMAVWAGVRCDGRDPIPPEIFAFVHGRACFKIERMEDGVYIMSASECYKRNFGDEGEFLKRAIDYKIPPKLVDTCNLEDGYMAYTMWVNSVRLPNCVHGYEGKVFWGKVGRVYVTKVSMMSVVVHYNTIVTATVLSYD